MRRERVSNTGKNLFLARASCISFGLSGELWVITNANVLVQFEANKQLVGEALVHVDKALNNVLMSDCVEVDRVGLGWRRYVGRCVNGGYIWGFWCRN